MSKWFSPNSAISNTCTLGSGQSVSSPLPACAPGPSAAACSFPNLVITCRAGGVGGSSTSNNRTLEQSNSRTVEQSELGDHLVRHGEVLPRHCGVDGQQAGAVRCPLHHAQPRPPGGVRQRHLRVGVESEVVHHEARLAVGAVHPIRQQHVVGVRPVHHDLRADIIRSP
eukprot:1195452-Prorocentrum_minimum.AAC.3